MCRWNVLLPIINSMFITKNEETLNSLFDKGKQLCGHMDYYDSILVKFMNKKDIGHHLLLITPKGLLKTWIISF